MKTFAFALLFLGLAAFGLAGLAAADPAAANEADDDTQDVLYLGHPHPVMLRLHLRAEGRSTFAQWDGFMAKLFAHLDRNKSGGLDRIEASKVPTPQNLSQLFTGNILLNTDPRMRQVSFETLDADRDGKVTLDELKTYYKNNGCGPVIIQAMYAPAFTGNTDPTSDRLFNLIDTNKDGKLSKEELLAAEHVLMKYDTNDDELISMQELGLNAGNDYRVGGQFIGRQAASALSVALVEEGQRRLRQMQLLGWRQGPTVLMLVPKDDSGRRVTGKLNLTRDVLKRYDKDKDGKLTRGEIGFPQAMFDRFDRNKDGKLDVLELLRWTKEKPSGEFTVRLEDGRGMMMRARGPSKPRTAAKPDDRMSVALNGVRITIVSENVRGRSGYEQYLLSLFAQVDQDKKGFLTRKQIEAQQFFYLRPLFDLADTNSDGRLTLQELKTYLALIAEAAGKQWSLSLASTGQGLFQALDANSDGQLSVREMRNAWARLADLDWDGDGCISRSEFPQQFRLLVSNNPIGAAYYGQLVASPAMTGASAPARQPARGPLWFHKMDRNGDGDVSRTEWLGSKEDFDRIDSDKDGLISVEEAEAFDARTRKSSD